MSTYVILGATGHVGSVVASALLERGEAVTLVARNARKARSLAERGARVTPVDVRDVEALRRVFREGRRAFLLNPSAAPSGDTDREERETVRAILAALKDSGLEKVVAQSTYGAQPGEHNGDLGVLHELEQGLARQPVPASVMRGAYFMSNWDFSLETARTQGVVQTLFPVYFRLPMVAPEDLGRVAARLLTEPAHTTGLHSVEGPQWYCAADVAAAFQAALGRPVKAVSTPREDWAATFEGLGFSRSAAESYARMTALTLEARFPDPARTVRGSTTLEAYVEALVASAPR